VIAVDVRVSLLEIVALLLAHTIIAGLLIEASLSRFTAFFPIACAQRVACRVAAVALFSPLLAH
jgi:hypothetical protein